MAEAKTMDESKSTYLFYDEEEVNDFTDFILSCESEEDRDGLEEILTK